MTEIPVSMTEAAARAIFDAWQDTPMLVATTPPEEGECREFASTALVAAGVPALLDALAAVVMEADPKQLSYDNQGCIYCWALEPEGYPYAPTIDDFASLPHEPDCRWRRAYDVLRGLGQGVRQ